MSKVSSMSDAVADLVHDGDVVAIEGFTHLICFAAGHEIIRQRKRDLTLARLTPDLIYDQMVAAGTARKLVFSWLGNPGVGGLHAIRRRVESADPAPLELEEYSHFGMVGRYTAGASNLPFFPLRSYFETDLPKANPLIRPIRSPYGDETVYAVPPLKPDVTVVHAQRADAEGNTQMWGLLGCQKEAAFAAERVIVVVEELCPESVIRADPNRTVIPGLIVDAVVVEPWGAHPSYVGLRRQRPGGVHTEARGRKDRLAAAFGRGAVGFRRLRGLQMSEQSAPTGASPAAFSKSEMMIVAAARELAGQRVCFVGVGLPNIAVNLARLTCAPTLELVYESGAFGAKPARLPLSIGDPTIVTGATAAVSMFELFSFYLQGGRVDVGFLGAAQIDRFGNINSTVIGDYEHPKTRLPGSGGACEIAINARQVFVIMRQSKRSFVERIDFRTSPGNLGGAENAARIRREQGWLGRGPSVVVTDLGIYHFDDSGEMRLDSIHPGATLEQIRDTMGWEPRVAEPLATTPAPTGEELRLIREQLDPEGAYTK
jgi:glutaconate CoA-transferase subunit A